MFLTALGQFEKEIAVVEYVKQERSAKAGVITIERVTQVDFVSQRVAQLDPYKLSVPGSLHKLLPIAFGVGVSFKRELSPDGVFACEEII